jgi:hypothetical protein
MRKSLIIGILGMLVAAAPAHARARVNCQSDSRLDAAAIDGSEPH